ncbi:methylated-DNA-[protein]-cysteine S-methyltransferase [Chitinophaga skermanii]|uniref:Methylated-DNA--protein-cysteine methyltransferase n=1 Tax=Chitinophaga skermanii TaxID=331697 RepID=A0A327R4T8_9BACT|nr:methylated-DNA--[protein]-cysteine S-methyltransferase [Chitinophaga skermanii]RAJ08907.1 methylated-DNA-[protein]-cysteine S-methyltransferase [Chitinophaga skermanii]
MEADLAHVYVQSPVGILSIWANDRAVTTLQFEDDPALQPTTTTHPILQAMIAELGHYFEGTLQTFTVPLEQSGTPFQLSVWEELRKIPYGRTITYMQEALNLGNPKSIRAVGTANGRNTIAIVVPCHRVIGASGQLVGFAGGVWRKQWLLEHEKKIKYGQQLLF